MLPGDNVRGGDHGAPSSRHAGHDERLRHPDRHPGAVPAGHLPPLALRGADQLRVAGDLVLPALHRAREPALADHAAPLRRRPQEHRLAPRLDRHRLHRARVPRAVPRLGQVRGSGPVHKAQDAAGPPAAVRQEELPLAVRPHLLHLPAGALLRHDHAPVVRCADLRHFTRAYQQVLCDHRAGCCGDLRDRYVGLHCALRGEARPQLRHYVRLRDLLHHRRHYCASQQHQVLERAPEQRHQHHISAS